jgi:hypothetical protein
MINNTNVVSNPSSTIGNVPITCDNGLIVFDGVNTSYSDTTNNVIRLTGSSVCRINGAITFTGAMNSLIQAGDSSEIHIPGTATLNSTGATVSLDNFRLFHSARLLSTASLANVSNGSNSVVNLVDDVITIPAGSLRLSLPIDINSRGQRQTQGGYKRISSYTAVQTLSEIVNHVVLSTADITLPATANLPGLGKEYIIKNTNPTTNIVVDVDTGETDKIFDNSATAVDTITILPGGTVTLVFDGTYYQMI